jgi:hypothetical protein
MSQVVWLPVACGLDLALSFSFSSPPSWRCAQASASNVGKELEGLLVSLSNGYHHLLKSASVRGVLPPQRTTSRPL